MRHRFIISAEGDLGAYSRDWAKASRSYGR
jgi:hypothetical protein